MVREMTESEVLLSRIRELESQLVLWRDSIHDARMILGYIEGESVVDAARRTIQELVRAKEALEGNPTELAWENHRLRSRLDAMGKNLEASSDGALSVEEEAEWRRKCKEMDNGGSDPESISANMLRRVFATLDLTRWDAVSALRSEANSIADLIGLRSEVAKILESK